MGDWAEHSQLEHQVHRPPQGQGHWLRSPRATFSLVKGTAVGQSPRPAVGKVHLQDSECLAFVTVHPSHESGEAKVIRRPSVSNLGHTLGFLQLSPHGLLREPPRAKRCEVQRAWASPSSLSPPPAQGCPHPALHPGLSHSAVVSLPLKIFNIWFKMAGPSVRFLSPKFPWRIMERT